MVYDGLFQGKSENNMDDVKWGSPISGNHHMGKAEFLWSKPVKYDHQTSICHQNLVGGLNPSEKYESQLG
jgi:hypothetical protein